MVAQLPGRKRCKRRWPWYRLQLRRFAVIGLVLATVVVSSCTRQTAPIRTAAERFSTAVLRIADNTGSSSDDVASSLRARLGVADDVTDDAAARAERLADETAWIDDAARQAAPDLEEIAKQALSSSVCDAVELRLDSGSWPDDAQLSSIVFGNFFDQGIISLGDEQSAAVQEVAGQLEEFTASAESEMDLLQLLVSGGCLFA